jgi:hypothetical protein
LNISLHFFFLEKKKTCAKTLFLKKNALPKKAYAANVLKKVLSKSLREKQYFFGKAFF